MIPVETLAAFFAASLLLALSPGPDNLFVLAQAATQGSRAGLAVVLGLCTGLIVHSSAVALGVAALFRTSAPAFTALKILGAGYLLFLAAQTFRSSGKAADSTAPPRLRLRRLYLRGIVLNVTNPKVSIFFLAFLPQFADPARGSISVQIFLLGAVFMLATVLVFGGIALLAGRLGDWFTGSEKARTVLNRAAGLLFLGLALKLALARR